MTTVEILVPRKISREVPYHEWSELMKKIQRVTGEEVKCTFSKGPLPWPAEDNLDLLLNIEGETDSLEDIMGCLDQSKALDNHVPVQMVGVVENGRVRRATNRFVK